MHTLRFALRQLRKSPGFATVAILTLAVGIGTCSAMFGILRAVLLKPLPFHEPERLVWIENVFGGGLSGRTSRVDVFNGWREQNKSFESLAAYFAFFDYSRQTLTGSGEPARLRCVGVSDNFLPTLGVQPLHGRNFTAEECAWNGPRAVLLSHDSWRRRFAGDASVVGRSITLNNAPTTIVGVLPRSFDFDAIFFPGAEVELVSPFPLTAETANWGNTLFGIGRLRPGVTLEQAQNECTVISEQLRTTTLAGMGTFGGVLRPLDTALRGRFRPVFLLLAGAVACVLAIACVNLSNLLLARANVRRQEFAVRFALGARRWHLVRQTLTESLVLAFAGAVLGAPIAAWATHLLARLKTFGIPLLQDASVDFTALGVTILLTTVAGIICGVLPAVYLTHGKSASTLHNASHQRTAGRTASAARGTLVIAEVALACVLLVSAGLLLRSFAALLEVQLGFQPQQAAAWRVDAPRAFADNAQATQYMNRLVESVAALPGVEAVGLSDCLPLGRNRTWGAGAMNVEYPAGTYPIAYPRVVDHRYLQAMQIPLLAGRMFDERDNATAERVAIINESLARQLWPDRDPVGQMLAQFGGTKVIGVVGNVRHGSLEQGGGNEMYFDFRQGADWSAMEMVVRSSRPLASLARDVRGALAAHDPELPSSEFYPLERLIDNAVAPRRLFMRLLSFFSIVALTLAALGLYGVIAYAVTQRTREIGVRMAVGAQRTDVLQLILGGGLKLVLVGMVLGLAGSLAFARVLQTQLYHVTAYDPLTLGANAALLVGVGACACLMPALRATRVDPLIALRAE